MDSSMPKQNDVEFEIKTIRFVLHPGLEPGFVDRRNGKAAAEEAAATIYGLEKIYFVGSGSQRGRGGTGGPCRRTFFPASKASSMKHMEQAGRTV